MARKCVIGLVFVAAALANTGCVANQYASNPNVRTEQLVNQSEDFRQIGEFWRRFWFNEMPSHLTTERINGGILR